MPLIAISSGLRQQEKEASKEIELNAWFVQVRQKALASAMHRRDHGEESHPDDARVLDDVARMPWFYGLDVAPPADLTGQLLVRVINEQGGLGSSAVVLSDPSPD